MDTSGSRSRRWITCWAQRQMQSIPGAWAATPYRGLHHFTQSTTPCAHRSLELKGRCGCTACCEYETEASWEERAIMGCPEGRRFNPRTAKVTSPTISSAQHSQTIMYLQPHTTLAEIFSLTPSSPEGCSQADVILLLAGWCSFTFEETACLSCLQRKMLIYIFSSNKANQLKMCGKRTAHTHRLMIFGICSLTATRSCHFCVALFFSTSQHALLAVN